MFNFYKNFQEYSVDQLQQIVAEAHKYQPEAVSAAKQLLDERGEPHFRPVSTRQIIDQVNNQMNFGETHELVENDLLTEFEEKSEQQADTRIWTTFVLIAGIIYIYSFYVNARSIPFFIRNSELGAGLLLSVGFGILSLIIIFLLLTKRNNGWILAVIENFYSLSMFVTNFLPLLLEPGRYEYLNYTYVLFIVVRICLVTLLFTKSICKTFNVDKKIKTKAIILSVAIIGAAFLIQYIISHAVVI